MPHEFKGLPLTYFQTLVNHVYEPVRVNPEKDGDGADEDGLKPVDVDELIRKGELGRAEI